jgi:hypothetical protein
LHARLLAAASLTLVLPAGASAAEPAETGRGSAATGNAVILLPDTSTLEPGRLLFGFVVDNRDRDPLGIDVFDAFLSGTVGLHRRIQLETRLVVIRNVTVPQDPPLPPPPADLVALPGAQIPEKRHTLLATAPYVNARGNQRLDKWMPGEAVIGLKGTLFDAQRWRPALAVVAEVSLPMARALPDLRSGTGSGTRDVALRGIAEWKLGPTDLLATGRYTRVGRGATGDRIIRLTPREPPAVTDERLRLPDRLDLGLAVRTPLRPHLWLVGEIETSIDYGHARTPVLDPPRPLDFRVGLSSAFGPARLLAALRYHANSARAGDHPSPMAGMIDITDVRDGELREWLAGLGASEAYAGLRPGTHRVVAGVGATQPLPAGAWRMAETYHTGSRHQVGFTLAIAFAF